MHSRSFPPLDAEKRCWDLHVNAPQRSVCRLFQSFNVALGGKPAGLVVTSCFYFFFLSLHCLSGFVCVAVNHWMLQQAAVLPHSLLQDRVLNSITLSFSVFSRVIKASSAHCLLHWTPVVTAVLHRFMW